MSRHCFSILKPLGWACLFSACDVLSLGVFYGDKRILWSLVLIVDAFYLISLIAVWHFDWRCAIASCFKSNLRRSTGFCIHAKSYYIESKT